ncbi:MAG TPA: hypothetical protein VMQ10_02475 [Spirochaetia bacterium]|nr:hypothetical protein [Spirochaetia bacterium]
MARKAPIIDLPVKITLTADGVERYRRAQRPLNRIRMGDDRLEYGISLSSFSAEALQKMINVDYISAVEIARTEFSDKRREVIDLNKLIVYRILYHAFERESYALLLKSPLITRWNRTHPKRLINESTLFDSTLVQALLNSCAADLPLVSQDIQSGLLAEIHADPDLSAEEKEVMGYLSDRYVVSMRNVLWCVLARSRGEPGYEQLVSQLVSLLRRYLDKSKIAEYLALMVTELLTYVESLRLKETARRLARGKGAGEVLRDPALRATVLQHLQQQEDFLHLTYFVGSRGPSIGTEDRLRILVYNRASEYRRVKTQIESKALLVGEKSLAEFYRRAPSEDLDTELGLYYLSFLHAECARCQVHLDSRVSEVPQSDLTVINLSLRF